MTLYLPVIFVTEDPLVFLVRRYSLINADKKYYSHSDQTTSKSAPICRGFARVALINSHGNGENLPNSCEFK